MNRWSSKVTHNSHSLDLVNGLYAWDDPHEIALSLKRGINAKPVLFNMQCRC